MHLNALYCNVSGRSDDLFMWPERPNTYTRQHVQAGLSRMGLSIEEALTKGHCSAAGSRLQVCRLLEKVALSSNTGTHASWEAVVYVAQCVVLHLAKGTGNGGAQRLEAGLLAKDAKVEN